MRVDIGVVMKDQPEGTESHVIDVLQDHILELKFNGEEIVVAARVVGGPYGVGLKPATQVKLQVGTRLVLEAWPEEGIDHAEVVVIESIADEERPEHPGEGRESLCRVPAELREEGDYDGMREVFFDEDTLRRAYAF